jgi:hypothetical protein
MSEAILFDLDDTLIDHRQAVLEALAGLIAVFPVVGAPNHRLGNPRWMTARSAINMRYRPREELRLGIAPTRQQCPPMPKLSRSAHPRAPAQGHVQPLGLGQRIVHTFRPSP